MKRIILLISLWAMALPLRPGISPEIFGYLETQASGAAINGELYFINTNKLRLDLKSKISEKITFQANLNLKTFHGKEIWNIPDFLPAHISSQIPAELLPLYSVQFADEIKLDNAWLKMGFKKFDLIVGKQQISLGTGYVWNPLDVFNIKDVLDPTYEQPGHNAFRIDIPLGSTSSLTGLFSPEDSMSESAKLVRLKTRISHFDLILMAIEKQWKFSNFDKFDFQSSSFGGISEKRRVLGAAVAGELLGIGLWAEAAWNRMEVTENFSEIVAGMDYTFDFQTHVMAEYYRNSRGRTHPSQYDLNDYMRVYMSELKSMARDQLYVMATHPVSDLMTLSAASIICLSDGSASIVPSFTYNLADNVDITGYLNINTGKQNELYAWDSGSGGLIRIRAYF